MSQISNLKLLFVDCIPCQIVLTVLVISILFEIKKYICKFINDYLPNLEKDIQNKFEIYFCLYGLERYERLHNGRTVEFNIDEAYRRYNFLFKELIKETSE